MARRSVGIQRGALNADRRPLTRTSGAAAKSNIISIGCRYPYRYPGENQAGPFPDKWFIFLVSAAGLEPATP